MKGTKDRILLEALHLFSQEGYEAVSVSRIAGMLGITKGALYKHYESKRDILDSILALMESRDSESARRYGLPVGTLSQMEGEYRSASMEGLVEYSLAQFRYWTEEDIPSSFRKMLTLEQYGSEEMGRLYRQYFLDGPLGYVSDLFGSWGMENPEEKALTFYAPMFLCYSLYDSARDKSSVFSALKAQMIL